MKKKLAILLIMAIFTASPLFAGDPLPEPVFRALLESDVNATAQGGFSIPCIVKSKSHAFEPIQDGRMGILRGDCKGPLVYKLPSEEFKNHEGSISFWVKILFEPMDHHFFQFFTLYTNGLINIFKHEGGPKIILQISGRDLPRQKSTLVKFKNTYQKEDVIHFAVTWIDGYIQAYWNGETCGELAANTIIAPNLSTRADVVIGGHALTGYGVQSNLSTETNMIIRDFRIYNEQLDAGQIEQIYQSK